MQPPTPEALATNATCERFARALVGFAALPPAMRPSIKALREGLSPHAMKRLARPRQDPLQRRQTGVHFLQGAVVGQLDNGRYLAIHRQTARYSISYFQSQRQNLVFLFLPRSLSKRPIWS